MRLQDLTNNEFSPFYKTYIEELENVELIEGLKTSFKQLKQSLKNISEEKFNYRYTEEKWTIKELLQHLIDTERIMSYRALRFSRNDATALEGFDENWYVTYSNSNQRNGIELLKELKTVRKATILMFNSFSPEALKQIGTANGNDISVRALGFIIAGHQTHHLKILMERYF